MKSFLIHRIVPVLAYIISLFIVNIGGLSDYGYSILVCSNFLLVLLLLWHLQGQRLTPTFLFYITFSFLFIGGRFWGILLGYGEPLWVGNFFSPNDYDDEQILRLLTYLFTYLYCFYLGCYLVYGNKTKKIVRQEVVLLNSTRRIDHFLQVTFYVVAPLVLLTSMQTLIRIIGSGNYLSLYADQTESYSSGSALMTTVLYCLFGFAMAYGRRRVQLCYMTLFLLNVTIGLMIGARGGFGAILMFILWYVYQNKKVPITKIALIGLGCIFLLLFLVQFSVRSTSSGEDSSALSAWMVLAKFFYDQGVSMAVFESSMDVPNYPAPLYIQSFIPGTLTLYQLLWHTSVSGADIGFGNYLAHWLNPALYNRGFGLGWTVMGSFYLFGGRNIIGFAIVATLFTVLCCRCETKARTSLFYKAIVYTLFVNFMVLPRGDLIAIFPLAIYAILIRYILIKALRIQTNFVLLSVAR